MSVGTFHEQSVATQAILSNRQNIRRFLKSVDVDYEQLSRIINRLSAVRDEIEEEIKKEEEEHKEKLKKIEETKKILQENGLSLEDLVQTERGNGAPRKSKSGRTRSDAGKPKHNPVGIYAYEDENGQRKEIQMPRVGRAPAEFSEYLKKTGKKRKECLVKELDENEHAKAS